MLTANGDWLSLPGYIRILDLPLYIKAGSEYSLGKSILVNVLLLSGPKFGGRRHLAAPKRTLLSLTFVSSPNLQSPSRFFSSLDSRYTMAWLILRVWGNAFLTGSQQLGYKGPTFHYSRDLW